MSIKTYYNAAICATYDRRDVRNMSKRKVLSPIEKSYFNELVTQTGPSVHNPIKVIRNWFKAYQQNIVRQKEIEAINAPFQKISFIKKIIKHM